MNVDGKFTICAINEVNGNTYSEEDSLLLCAKDRAVPAAIWAYQQECIKLGCSEVHIESVGKLYDRVVEYQAIHETKIPDTSDEEIANMLEDI